MIQITKNGRVISAVDNYRANIFIDGEPLVFATV